MTANHAVNYLEGDFAPVTEEVTAFDLPVIGTLPEALDGRYLRNGPNPVSAPDPTDYHWFLGDGMVHGIRLRGGRAEWYRNRWVRSPAVAAALGEDPPPNPFPADRPVFAANTNVIGLAGRTYALVEAGTPPIELSDTLDTVGPSDLGGTLPHAFSAHPKVDPATGRLHVAAYWWGWGSRVQYLVVEPGGTVSSVVDVDLVGDHSPMMHDLSITATRAVLYDLPCVFDLELATSGRALPYRWKPGVGARLGVLPLEGGAPSWVELDRPCYVYHPVNARDLDDGGMELVVVVHDRTFDVDTAGPGDGTITLERWVIDPALTRVARTVLDDRGQEFPRIDERVVGREARYGYCVELADGRTGGPPTHGALLRHDLRSGEVVRHDHGPGRSTMETVFVPADGDAAEDEGWLLSVVHDAGTGRGELVVLDAADLDAAPVARVLLPGRVPFGFHGNWVPATG